MGYDDTAALHYNENSLAGCGKSGGVVLVLSCFTGRAETVKEEQQGHDVPFGVVQCGTLGPIMFSLYTNDLVSHITYGKLISYDSQILHSGDAKSSMLKR